MKRSLRDPYEDWWDPIERRNYGEPVHEDNDILGVFSTEEYRHFTTRWGFVLLVRRHGLVIDINHRASEEQVLMRVFAGHFYRLCRFTCRRGW